MKPLLLASFIAVLFASCQSSAPDNESVQGTYTRISDDEINTLYDTVSFKLVNDQAKNVYNISERSSTQFKKEEDKSLNKKTSRTITGNYDPENKVMRIDDPGLVYSFDFNNNTVSINSIVYKKIK